MTYTGTLHAATHMDAPNHVLHEEEVDRARNGYSLNEIPLEYCIGTGVIIDMRYLKDEFEAKWKTGFEDGLWVEIKPADVEKALKKDGLDIRPKTTGSSSTPASITTGASTTTSTSTIIPAWAPMLPSG